MSIGRNVVTRGGAVVTLALCFSLLTVLPGGATFATAAAAVATDDLSPEVTEVDGATTGAEQFSSPMLPDQVSELPEGSDAVDPGATPGTAWADLTGVPVEVRSADEVTVLPETPEDAAVTEPVPAADAEPVPVEVTVEPSGEGQTPALFLDIQKTTAAAAEPTVPGIPTLPEPTETPTDSATGEPSATPSASGRVALEPEPSPSGEPTPTGEPTETPTGTPTGEPTDAPTDTPAEELDGGDAVEVRISYADFRYAYGGDWGSRLRVMAYPSCFLTTPEEPGCGQGVEVPSVNDLATQTVTFTTADLDAVPFPEIAPEGESPEESSSASPSESPSDAPSESPSASPGTAGRAAPGALVSASGGSGGTTYALSASPAGQVGNFAAQPIKPSASWQVGEGSGDFGYSYPFSLPAPAVGGSTPSLALSYSSGAVDGMNMAENGQASMMGLGWDLSTGYITREYGSCSDDGHTGMNDLCWRTTPGGDLVTQYSIVLNGRATKIVKDKDSPSLWRLQDDPGWLVGKMGDDNPGPGEPDNADPTNEAFLVRAPDGTEYWFGWGYGSDSVLTVPVFGDDPGEPCHNATFGSSSCYQGWRWGLDKVIDRKGNVTLYNYARVQNRYARAGNTAWPVDYDRDGYLMSIKYGSSRGGESAYTEVELTKKPRCIDALTTSATCVGAADAQNDPDGWPDVPSDLICDQGGVTCSNTAPSFFSTARYDQVITRRISNGTSFPVDSYQLNFQLPSNANDNPGNQSLWLSSIQRTGLDGTDITLPKVVFDGTWLQNRVTVPYGGSKFLRLRVNSIRAETGARMDVEYGHADNGTCDPLYVDTLDHDDSLKECYPRKLVNDNWEWWHKYVVKRVGLGDDRLGYRLGQSPDSSLNPGRLRVFDYEYIGYPGWRHRPSPLNNPNTDDEDETWDDWRGYEKVVVHTREVGTNQVVDASEGDISRRVVTRFRGLLGTKIEDPGVTERTDTVITAEGEFGDNSWLNGHVAQETTVSPTDVVLSRTSNEYGQVQTADSAHGLDGRYVYLKEQVAVPRADAAERVTTWTIDNGSSDLSLLGAVTKVVDNGGTGSASSQTGDDLCTQTEWMFNGDTGLRVPKWVTTRGGSASSSCSGSVEGLTDYFYDNSQTQTQVTEGDLAYTKVSVDDSGSNTSTITTKTTWDGYGRPLRQYLPSYNDFAGANGEKFTEFVYNPGAGSSSHALLTEVTTTTPPPEGDTGALVSTEQFTVARGLVRDTYDPNNAHTSASYDSLGRPTDVWGPDRNPATQTASVLFTYRDVVDNEGRVSTATIRPGGTARDTTYEYSDGWGRPIQTSTLNTLGGTTARMATMTAYDEAGRNRLSVAPFAIGAVAEAVVPSLSATPHYSETKYELEKATQPITVTERAMGTILRSTYTTHTGNADGVALRDANETTVSKTRTEYNAKFEVASVTQYANGVSADPNLDDGYAEYTYTPSGLLKTISTPAYLDAEHENSVVNVTYTYGYDRLGRRKTADDPDTGSTSYTYDAMGNTLTVDDAMPNNTTGIVKTSYDRLGRPTKRQNVVDGAANPTTLAEWVYDTASPYGKGRLAETVSHTSLGGVDAEVTTTVDDYDIRGNTTSTTQTYPATWTGEAASGTSSKTTTFSYDELGNVASTNYPAVSGLPARTVTTEHGQHGVFTGLYTEPTANSVRKIAEATYDELNRPTHLYSTASSSDTKGVKRYYTWSSDDRLKDIAARSLSTDGSTWFEQYKLAYVYDTAGNPTQVTGKRRDAQSPNTTYYGAWCYDYDGINRLTAAKTAVGFVSGSTIATSCVTPAADGEDANTMKVTGQLYDLDYTYAQTRLTNVTGTSTTGTKQTAYTYPNNEARPHAPTALATTGAGATYGLPSAGALSYDSAGRATTWTPSGVAATNYTYDAQGNLTSVDDTSSANVDITHAYDVDGIRIARKTSTETVVYLAGAEITKPATGNATSRRTYSTPGGTPVAIETPDGLDAGTSPDWTWLFADAQDTIRFTKTSDTANGTPAVTNHTYYPFGDPTTGASPLPGERGYLDKTHDPDGTIRLDHRSYDPGLNILTTPDPILRPGDPQTLNPYAYAGNNPITFSDPSGLDRSPNMPAGCVQTIQNCGPNGDGSPNPDAPQPSDSGSSGNHGQRPGGGAGESTDESTGEDTGAPVPMCYRARGGMKCVGTSGADHGGFITDFFNPEPAINTCKKDWFSFGCGWGLLGVGFKPAKAVENAADGVDAIVDGIRAGDRAGDTGKAFCSFGGETLVLMADGTTKPIDQVQVGDAVMATDPKTGEQTARAVTNVWVHEDALFKLVINGDAVTTTEDHPFWSVTEGRFKRADDLVRGELVLAVDGQEVPVSVPVRGKGRDGLAFNLAVDGPHTYYVLAGTRSVLVHNSNTCPTGKLSDPLPRGMNNKIASAYDDVKAGKIPSHGTYQGREHSWWAGAAEYRVPGRPDTDRILVKTLPGGVQVYGWTSTHYQKIQRFGAPHFPDSGWK